MNDTQRYAVYHANDVLETNLPPAMRWYADKSMYYTHVADVVAPLEQVFTLTNHIDHPWTDNPEVVWLATSRIRSTSVGDIIVSCESGQAWLVMPIGLRELPPLQGMHPGHEQRRTFDEATCVACAIRTLPGGELRGGLSPLRLCHS